MQYWVAARCGVRIVLRRGTETMRSSLVCRLVLAAVAAFAVRLPARGADAAATKRDVYTIGVVKDGACPHFDALEQLVEQELNILVGERERVVFKRTPDFSAGWAPKRAGQALRNALNDPEVQLVFAAGLLVAQEAARENVALGKPVISGFIQDPDAMGLPYTEEGRSAKKNFTFVVVPGRSVRDIETFHQMLPFKRLGILVDKVLLDGIEKLGEGIRYVEDQLKVSITPIPMDVSAQQALRNLPPDVDAVYLTPPLRMAESAWQELIDGLTARKLPTFSLRGRRDVELGVLAGQFPEAADRLARRIALNTQQIMMGVAPEELQVRMAIDRKLLINAKTAAEIGYSPPLEILRQAESLHLEALETGAPLDLDRAVRTALRSNIDLAVKLTEVEQSRQERNQALSALFPQVEANAQYTEVDDDRARTSNGSLPQQETTAGVSVTQILYNDPVISQYRAARRSYLGSVDDQESTRLDVIEDAARAFVQFLQSKVLVRIEADNLRLTRTNLGLARIRHEVGNAGPEEVYRWEAELASQKATLLDAESDVETARAALNQAMGVALDARWRPQDIEVGEDGSYFMDDRLRGLLTNKSQVRSFEEFVVREALANSPALKSLDSSIQAQTIMLSQYKRRFVLPELVLSFTYDHLHDEKELSQPPRPTTPTDDHEWVLALQASIPLFEGGGRLFAVAKAKAELDEALGNRRAAAQLIEQRARSVVYGLESSYPNVRLQRTAADFSRKNLEVIKDKYGRGAVSILDLLDAQNQAFVANQRAAIAVYSYLEDLIELQRAISWFALEKTAQAKDEWASALRAFQQKSGAE